MATGRESRWTGREKSSRGTVTINKTAFFDKKVIFIENSSEFFQKYKKNLPRLALKF